MGKFWRISGKVSWPRIGLIAFVVLLLLSCFLLSVAGGNVEWYAVTTLPLMLPLTMGTRSQKILACCCLVLSLLLICRDNREANDRTRRVRESYQDKVAELEAEVDLLRKKAGHDEGGGAATVHADPRTLSDYFVQALLEDPARAYALMEDDFRSKTSADEFASFVKEMFPACAPTSRAELVKVVDGFNEADGRGSSEYQYRVTPDGDAAAVTLYVDVVRCGDRYAVRRFSMPTP